jgi:hypothetical protein
MSKGRDKLNEEDIRILNDIKERITIGVNVLQERGVRPANIQIELEWHIKKLLKGE